jgi:choline kinase
MLPVLLAAGLGRRLGGVPKALFELDGAALMSRAASVLAETGFRELAVVTGHGDGDVKAYCASAGVPVDLRWLHNERYADLNNFYTVSLACEALEGPLLFLNSDIVFMPEVIQESLEVDAEAVIAVDNSSVDAEAMGVSVRDERAYALGKHLPAGEVAGEFIGVSVLRQSAKDAYVRASDAALSAGEANLYYEDVFARLANDIHIGVARVEQADWAEIDSPEDVARAELVAAKQSRVSAG